MNPLLMIMNPRRIPEAMEAFEKLTIDCVYASGYTEPELVDVFADIIRTTDYTHYYVVSDDVVVRQSSIDAVVSLSDSFAVVTGWCNHDCIEPGVNLQWTPLPGYEHPQTREEWNWMHFAEVLSYPTRFIPTYFAGMCITGMSREWWREKFPFDCYPMGHFGGSDYHLSWRLQEAGIPIYAAREGFAFHLKKSWLGPSPAPLLLGPEYQEIRWQLW